MALAAQRTGRPVNQSDLGRDAGLPQATVHRHLNLLETGWLIARLAPLKSNPSSALVKARKLYWSDCGLGAWLANIRSRADLRMRADGGFWLEQTLFQSLQSWRALDTAKRRIWYWRERSGREVDFILEKEGVLVALEVKAARQVGLGDAAGIEALRASLGKRGRSMRGAVLYGGAARPLGERTHALPWGWLVPKV